MSPTSPGDRTPPPTRNYNTVPDTDIHRTTQNEVRAKNSRGSTTNKGDRKTLNKGHFFLFFFFFLRVHQRDSGIIKGAAELVIGVVLVTVRFIIAKLGRDQFTEVTATDEVKETILVVIGQRSETSGENALNLVRGVGVKV